MLNLYRHFLPHTTATQAPLHALLAGPRTKGSQPVTWTPALSQAIEDCKTSLSHAAMLAHPDGAAPISLVTDASTTAMGALLQRRAQNAPQLLAFFSKKMSTAQQKYSAYDRELLAIYEAVKHFRHMLEARHFVIFTDHKLLTYAFSQRRDKCSPWQFNHLDFISQFTTDIRHISGRDSVVADALSGVAAVSTSVSPKALAAPRPGGASHVSRCFRPQRSGGLYPYLHPAGCSTAPPGPTLQRPSQDPSPHDEDTADRHQRPTCRCQPTVKPAYTMVDPNGRTVTARAPPEQTSQPAPQASAPSPPAMQTTCSGCCVRFSARFNV